MSVLNPAGARAWHDDAYAARSAPPPLPRHWVRRDRLNRQLSLAVQYPLTVVTGPPGAGKSVLLADWNRSGARSSEAWLTVEDSDNDPGRFWQHVAAALVLDPADRAFKAENVTHLEHDHWITPLLRNAAAIPPSVLILDDFHLITEPIVIGSVARLANRLPPHIRLVLSGQNIPDFPWQGLLTRGTGTRISDADLRFTLAEAAALVALAAGTCLSLDELRALRERTTGSAAALHSTAMALNTRNDRSQLEPQSSAAANPRGYLEPLTEREKQVLGYLPTHLSQRQIAVAMYLSLHTVKSHTKAIYRKIDANSRAEAVTIARTHGLL
jgi:ATP/maltotriose-dependent transcriptional regulator MalT